MHIFTNYFKVLIRNKAVIFWTLLFPIILGGLFHFAFGNLANEESFKNIPVGLVESEGLKANPNFEQLLEDLSEEKDGEEPIFALNRYKDEDTAKAALHDGDIEGYFLLLEPSSKPPVKIVVAKSGIDQTIMKEVAEQYFQSFSIIGVLYDKGLIGVPQQGQPEVSAQIGQPADPAEDGVAAYMAVLNGETNFVDKSNDKVDSTVIYFYTLLAMVCMYGASFGISAVSEIQANLSRRAARMMVGPVSKIKALGQTVLAGFIILYAEVVLVLFYLEKVLDVTFGDQRGYIFLLCFFGCFAGMGMGAFIGCSNRKSEDFKVGISILVTMTCCALGGMMYINLRFIIKDNIPILDAINPITMITDGLYSLYCYTDHVLLWNSIVRLSVFGVVFLAFALWIMRGKRYDSI